MVAVSSGFRFNLIYLIAKASTHVCIYQDVLQYQVLGV